MGLKELIEKLGLFERERTPIEIRILGIAAYLQTSSTRRTAKILSSSGFAQRRAQLDKEVRRETSQTEKKRRNLVAIDETIVKANRKRYYVYVAIDAERNELILMSLQGKESFDCEVPRQECLITAMESPNS